MRRRWFVLALALLLALVFAVGTFMLWPREPSYQGRPLGLWLADMRAAIFAGDYSTNTPAVLAIRNIGTNGFPTLIRILRASDSWPKQMVMKWGPKQKLIPLQLKSADERRYDAVIGYQALGALAVSQVPTLAEILDKDPSPKVRQAAASALGNLGPGARLAATALFRAAKDKDNFVRNNSLWALSRILPDPEATIPILIAALDDPFKTARENAAIALGRYATQGSNASLTLTRAVATNNTAGFALKLINPEAAAKVGVR